MAKIFISYRRSDSAPYAGRLYDRLVVDFDASQIFMDLEIEPGDDFIERLNEGVSQCDVLMVLIGPTWLSATDEGGTRRLDDPADYARNEVAAALRRDIRVVPVLVGGAEMPTTRELPEDLQALGRRQAIELSDLRFRSDVEVLVGIIERELAARAAKAEQERREAAERSEVERAEAERKAIERAEAEREAAERAEAEREAAERAEAERAEAERVAAKREATERAERRSRAAALREKEEPDQRAREPERDRDDPRTARRRLVAGTAALAALGLGAGLLLAPSDDVKAEGRVTEGNLAVSQPSDWERDVAGGRAIGGLKLDDVIAFTYTPSMGRSIMRAGAVSDPGPPLDPIPADLAARFKAAPDPKGVTLSDGTDAVQYDGKLSDGSTVMLVMIPTGDGYQSVACEAPTPGFHTIADDCEETMAGTKVVDTQPTPVGADKRFASDLSSVLTDLGKGQDAAASGLDADEPGKQADAANDLAAAYTNAAAQLRKFNPPSEVKAAVERLAKAYDAEADAFARLAQAVKDEDAAAYADAQADAQAAGQDAADAQDELAQDGYRFTGG